MTCVLTRLIVVQDFRSPSRVEFKMGAEGILYLGQRISSGGDIGTVRYLGPVPPTKGDWVGVEWDEPSRGKHNGTKNGVVYFECSHETGGSFVKPHKISAGISIATAILDRYAGSDVGLSGLENVETYLSNPVTNQKMKIEAVGMEKAHKVFKNLSNLRAVSLRMQDISHVGDGDFLENRAPNIEELDLSKNLFHEWESISGISKQLCKLKQLNLSENKLQIPKSPADMAHNFSSLRIIILNNCGLTWINAMSLSSMWPQICELHLGMNNISAITRPEDEIFCHLRVLNLTGNPVESWEHVKNLASLRKLEKLILNNCSLDQACIDLADFPALTNLTLSGNKFCNEDIFDQLNKLPVLNELNFRNNPVLEKESSETMREIIIAKIRGLKMLNRSAVDAIERQGAEMDYMKRYGKYWRESGGNQDPVKNNPSSRFLNDHPRYLELVKVHGAMEDGEFLIKSTALKSNLLQVTIVVPAKPELRPLEKKLPHSMTVGALKMMIYRLLKIPIKEQRLEYVSHHNPDHVVSMSKDTETLYYISLESGDRILVHPKWADRKWTVKFC